MGLEDTVAGDYTPDTSVDVYRDSTARTITPIHTGEQIYLRHNFKALIEKQAVNIPGSDPVAHPIWGYDIVEGLPNPIVQNSMSEVWDRPGLGVNFIVDEAQKQLAGEDQDFFS